MNPTKHILVVLVAVCCSAVGTTARAEKTALFVGGSASDEERTEFVSVARRAVETMNWTVTVPKLSAREFTQLQGCAKTVGQESCVSKFLDGADVERGLVLRVANETRKGEQIVVLTGYVLRRQGSLIAMGQRYCERCRREVLRDHVRELSLELVRKAKAETKPTSLLVRSNPGAAIVIIDDQPVGPAGIEFGVYAGKHTVRIEKEGYQTETREVVLEDGERATLDVGLRPMVGQPPVPTNNSTVPETKRPPRVKERSRLVPWAVLGGGLAVAAAGGVTFAFDEDAVQDGDKVPYYYNTTSVAIGVTAAGLVVAGVGGWLLYRSYDEAPPVVVGTDGERAWLGVQGTF